MLCFPAGGLMKTCAQQTGKDLKLVLVWIRQPQAMKVQDVYPPPPADKVISAVQRVQQVTQTLDQHLSKATYKQVTLVNKENAPVTFKRKRETEDRTDQKRTKVVQQTLAAFVNKV